MKRYDLMNQINARGTFLTSKACIPHLKRAANPHVLMLSPPLDMSPRWFAGHTAYSMAKFGMSMCVLGMSAEFAADGIAFNALWPRTGIATAAIKFALAGDEGMRRCRTVEIMADAAHAIFEKPAREFTGNFLIDDSFLYAEGVRDFDQYRVDPTTAADARLLRARRHPAAAGRGHRTLSMAVVRLFAPDDLDGGHRALRRRGLAVLSGRPGPRAARSDRAGRDHRGRRRQRRWSGSRNCSAD